MSSSSDSLSAIYVSTIEPPRGYYIVLNPNCTGVTRFPGLGIHKVVYPSSLFPSSVTGVVKYSIKSWVQSNDVYAIVDNSSVSGGLVNNQITIDSTLVTIPPGNYNALTLAATLQGLFNAVTPGFTVVYDAASLFLTIANATPFTLEMGVNSPTWELGIPAGTYTGITTITGSGPLNLAGPQSILVRINEIPTYNTINYCCQSFHFIYPLTGATPSQSQASIGSLGKLDCFLSQRPTLSQLTVSLWFVRGGQVYPYVGYDTSFYEILLQIV